MTLIDAINALDVAIPDDVVERELRTLLQKEAHDSDCVHIEFSEVEGGSIAVPLDVKIEIMTKSFFKEYLQQCIGDFRVQVAIGGAAINEGGVLVAKYCFATLWFNAQGQRFTIDFHLEVR